MALWQLNTAFLLYMLLLRARVSFPLKKYKYFVTGIKLSHYFIFKHNVFGLPL